jgi:hypothetical protein
MKKYIFITPEGLAYKPSCDSPEPDFQDIQIFTYGQNSSVQEAIEDLIELNENAMGTQSDRPFSLRIEKDNKKSFWVREKRDKIAIAS